MSGRAERRRRFSLHLRWKIRVPVTRNIHTPAHPHAIMRLNVIEEFLQCHEAPGPAEEAAMHADAEHLRRFVAFGI